MCGRFSLVSTETEITQEFGCSKVPLNQARYNIAPSQQVMVITHQNHEREAAFMKWGLIPHWVKSLKTWKSNLINARSETIRQKTSFRGAFKKRPCLIPVSGFYEWSKEKQPFYFHTEQSLFAFAGIWETWNNPETEERVLSCTILTSEAKGAISEVHHRMPVIIPTKLHDLWLGEVDQRQELIEALPEVDLQLYPVSKFVNSPKNNGSECIEATSA